VHERVGHCDLLRWNDDEFAVQYQAATRRSRVISDGAPRRFGGPQ
jgi:hypothetical protein